MRVDSCPRNSPTKHLHNSPGGRTAVIHYFAGLNLRDQFAGSYTNDEISKYLYLPAHSHTHFTPLLAHVPACVYTSNAHDFFPTNYLYSPGGRTAVIHYLAGLNLRDPFAGSYTTEEINKYLYPLGENSYFSESAYTMPGDSWHARYWGTENYGKLSEIKQKWDPDHVFGCHHCVGAR